MTEQEAKETVTAAKDDSSAKLLTFFAVFAIICGGSGLLVDCLLPHLHLLAESATSTLKAYLSFQCLVTVVTLITVAMKKPRLAIILFATSTVCAVSFFSHTHLTKLKTTPVAQMSPASTIAACPKSEHNSDYRQTPYLATGKT